MIGYREPLTDLVEKESRLHVVLGDNAKYTVKGVGTSSFQLDSDIPLQLSEVLYVPGVAVLMHTCKRELSPTHLVCPRRHNV
jgi:hypothetical protein